MLDVDALERLRDEALIRDCELQRLLNWYDPVGCALGELGYCQDEGCYKQQEDSAWFYALPEHRRKTIEARKWALEMWQTKLCYLARDLYDHINMRQAWLEFESVLTIVVPADVIPIIWNQVLDDKNEDDLRRWRFRMTNHLPPHPISPPCNYKRRRKRWKVRCRWKQLIKRTCNNVPLLGWKMRSIMIGSGVWAARLTCAGPRRTSRFDWLEPGLVTVT